MKTYRFQLLVLAIGFAILMSLPFLFKGFSLVSLVGLIPLLFLDKIGSDNNVKRLWPYYFLGFLLWNTFTTFWVCYATVGGGIFAIVANTIMMSLVFGGFRLSKKYYHGTVPYIFLMTFWITWELWVFNNEISWPWLCLGNSFAKDVRLIQWYEYTGVLGGSLWIWASNLALFGLINSLINQKWKSYNIKAKTAIIGLTFVILYAPIILSTIIYERYTENNDSSINVAIIQPNIDSYQKFGGISQEEQNNIFGNLAKPILDKDSNLLIIGPETFIQGLDLNNINEDETVSYFRNLIKKDSLSAILIGASSYEKTSSPNILSLNYDNKWYNEHNSAILVTNKHYIERYHKSKLVVGVEKTPYPKFFTKVENLLGVYMGKCIGQNRISLFNFDKTKIGCAICYESVYSDFYRNYAKLGAKAMTIITNDVWWSDTPGYKQHLSFASLRAIETRRDIARCANTGISAFINQRGDIVSKTKWWERTSLVGKLNLNSKITYYVQNGDIIGKLSCFIFIILSVAMLSKLFTRGGRKNA